MPEPVQFTKRQRNVSDTIATFMLYVARPFYWHNGASAQNRNLRGASAFILQFDDRFIGVTANHVLQEYLDAKASNPGLICQLANGRINPEQCIIAQSAELDIATFSLSPVQVPTFNGNVINCTGLWPPPDVEVGEAMSIVGYPEKLRRENAQGHTEFSAWGALGGADAVTDREIVSTYDPTREIAPQWAPEGLPPLGFNLSGCSGGPVILHKNVNGLQRFFPVGLIMRGPTGTAPGCIPDDRAALGDLGSFDRIHIRRLHYLQEDGSIAQPNIGWLP